MGISFIEVCDDCQLMTTDVAICKVDCEKDQPEQIPVTLMIAWFNYIWIKCCMIFIQMEPK